MIAIKGFKMPTGCYDCLLRVNGYCSPMQYWKYRGLGDRAPKYRPDDCPLVEIPDDAKIESVAIFDQEEVHENCTVQILTNSVTGDISIGWWPNDEEESDGE